MKCGVHRVFCDVRGIRYLPGIYWYPAKCVGFFLQIQGGTADSVCIIRP